MLIGYARVSTNDQETATQVAALKAAGSERIYREKASGGRWNRPELHRLLEQLREADVLVVVTFRIIWRDPSTLFGMLSLSLTAGAPGAD